METRKGGEIYYIPSTSSPVSGPPKLRSSTPTLGSTAEDASDGVSRESAVAAFKIDNVFDDESDDCNTLYVGTTKAML